MNVAEGTLIMMSADQGKKVTSLLNGGGFGGGLTFNDYVFIEDCTRNGDEWAIQWKHSVIPNGQFVQDPTVVEVADIFSMWDVVMGEQARLSVVDKATLVGLTQSRFSDGKFPGFDFTNESRHAHVADVLINKLNSFQYMGQDGSSNSHSSLVPKYLAMVVKFKQVKVSPTFVGFTVAELASIINA